MNKIFVILILILLYSCNQSGGKAVLLTKEDSNLQFKIVKKNSFNFSESIGRVVDFTADKEGNVYLLSNDFILKLALNLNKTKTIGRKGQGAGELDNPTSIFYDNNTLQIYNSNKKSISVFSNKGDFIKEIKNIPFLFDVKSGYLNSVKHSYISSEMILKKHKNYLSFVLHINDKDNTKRKINLKEINFNPFKLFDPLLEGIHYCLNDKNIFWVANISKSVINKVTLDSLNKKQALTFHSKKIEIPKEKLKELNKYLRKRIKNNSSAKYYPAILNLNMDKYKRLWVQVPYDKGSRIEDFNIKFKIVDIENYKFQDLCLKLPITDQFFAKQQIKFIHDKIYILNDDTISVFDY